MSRIIGIDYGEKKSGIAITDPLQIITYPLCTIKTKDLLYFINRYIEENNVKQVVIGESINKKGISNPIQNKINIFKKKLYLFNPKIYIYDQNEIYTSKIAYKIFIDNSKKKIKYNKEAIDKISASLILQSFLDKK